MTVPPFAPPRSGLRIDIRKHPGGFNQRLKWHLWLKKPDGTVMSWLGGFPTHPEAVRFADEMIRRNAK